MTLLKSTTLILAALIFLVAFAARAESQKFLVYIGTFTGKKSEGIYVSRFDPAAGKLSVPELAAQTPTPTFLAVSSKRILYAANEVQQGAITALAIDPKSGKLTPLNQQSSGGNGPCHLNVDASGKTLLVANYSSGSIAALPIQSDGRLDPAVTVIQHAGSSVNKNRQAGPHAHWIDADPANKFVLVCDLGLDKVMTYKFDPAKASLAVNDPAFATVQPGSGPRHIVFDPKGRFAYLLNEMGDTVTVFSYDATRGALGEIQTLSTLPKDFSGNSTAAELAMHPSGRFLYGSNRGHDSIVVYSIDRKTGKLALVEHQSSGGKTPRNFAIDPTGRWLLAANQDTDNIVIYRIDQKTGRLSPTGETVAVGMPVCLKFVAVEK